MTYRTALLLLCLPLALAACADGGVSLADRPSNSPAGSVTETAAVETVAAPTEAGTRLTTIATLGNPAQPGLWLRTPLVRTERPGRITTEGGQSAAVTLIPIAGDPGAGSQISLSAMQALGQPLTALVPLTVVPG